MTYKTVLAFLPTFERAERVLDVALPIADAHGSHLVGVHVVPDVTMFYGIAAGQFPADLIDQQRRVQEDEAAKIRQMFEKRGGAGNAKIEWRQAVASESDATQKFVNMSICADLIVADQSATSFSGGGLEVAARMVLGTARPVLVVPSAGKFGVVGKRPLIAWNGEKESARAAFDAIPLMRHAELVRILSIDPATGEGQDMVALGDELAICLARHGLKTEATVSRTAGLSIGDELLNRLTDY
ncbi:MAG: universal stress protein, partial [Hyphomicrobiaceae bacterium]|nr:universal stress protein [Hyphomicrobiaceae bacterium]